MSTSSIVFIDLSVPNMEHLQEAPAFLESHKGLTRYHIAEDDRSDLFGESEWFCDDCGARVEDTFDGCPVCHQQDAD